MRFKLIYQLSTIICLSKLSTLFKVKNDKIDLLKGTEINHAGKVS
jgi:hypothetical protein